MQDLFNVQADGTYSKHYALKGWHSSQLIMYNHDVLSPITLITV
jgi:hypothetical protein